MERLTKLKLPIKIYERMLKEGKHIDGHKLIEKEKNMMREKINLRWGKKNG